MPVWIKFGLSNSNIKQNEIDLFLLTFTPEQISKLMQTWQTFAFIQDVQFQSQEKIVLQQRSVIRTHLSIKMHPHFTE